MLDFSGIPDGQKQNTYNRLDLVLGYNDQALGGDFYFDDLAFRDSTGGIPVGTLIRELSTLTFYPNPTDHKVYIKSDEPVSAVQIYDVSGKLMRSITGHDINECSYVGLELGIYLMRIFTSGNSKQVHRVIRQ